MSSDGPILKKEKKNIIKTGREREREKKIKREKTIAEH